MLIIASAAVITNSNISSIANGEIIETDGIPANYKIIETDGIPGKTETVRNYMYALKAKDKL